LTCTNKYISFSASWEGDDGNIFVLFQCLYGFETTNITDVVAYSTAHASDICFLLLFFFVFVFLDLFIPYVLFAPILTVPFILLTPQTHRLSWQFCPHVCSLWHQKQFLRCN